MKLFLFIFVGLELAVSAAFAGETPETVLIRQALGNDLAGRRRGDIEVTLSSYAAAFVAYDAALSPDPRHWSILHENRATYSTKLKEDLKANRYDLERFVATIQVRGNKATATTVDSGAVVNRQTGARQTLRQEQFWTFLKEEDKWLITAQVQRLGATAPAEAKTASAPHSELTNLLQQEEKGWGENGSGLGDLVDEDFICYDASGATAPAKWAILFSNGEEWRNWLDKRFDNTSYAVKRQILHTALGPGGKEGLALSRDHVVASHEGGPTKHTKEQYVLWLLSQRDGSWKITNMLYGLGLPQ